MGTVGQISTTSKSTRVRQSDELTRSAIDLRERFIHDRLLRRHALTNVCLAHIILWLQ